METIIVILGLCITFIPVIIFINYLLNKVNKKTRFDYHLELVKDKKGNIGIIIAYFERILFGIVVSSFGVLLSEFFQNNYIKDILIISSITYVFVKYIDEKNTK